MKLNIERSVTVITPTIGSEHLRKAMQSVHEQTYKNIHHLIVVDGPKYIQTALENGYIDDNDSHFSYSITPENTGANGFYGHRIYAAYPHLVNSDYVMFLDEDNWYEPNHISSLVSTIERNSLEWAHSLRKVCDKDGNYLLNDDCESLGAFAIFNSVDQHLVDTSSYCFKREFLVANCHLWHHGWGADRRFFNNIRYHSEYIGSGEYTLNYRLDGNPNSVTKEFFEAGNKWQSDMLGGKFPWRKV